MEKAALQSITLTQDLIETLGVQILLHSVLLFPLKNTIYLSFIAARRLTMEKKINTIVWKKLVVFVEGKVRFCHFFSF